MSVLKIIYQVLINLPAILSAFAKIAAQIEEYKRKRERDERIKIAQEKYAAVVADPKSTTEEKSRAYVDFINS